MLGFQFLSPMGNGAAETNMNDFLQMVKKGHVERYEIVNNARDVKVWIKKDSIKYYPELQKPEAPKTALSSGNTPNVEFKITSGDNFLEQMTAFYNANPQLRPTDTPYKVSEVSDFFGRALGMILPFLLIIGIWILMMRKMSGGAGGPGGAGGIFNIGKSKATLFDKGTKVNITFADVAGLDEAKVEVMEIVDFLRNPKKYTALGAKYLKARCL